MICTSVVPIFVLLPWPFAILKGGLFFENEGTNLTPKQSNSMLSQFFKSTTIK